MRATDFFTTFVAGYRLDKLRKTRVKTNHPLAVSRLTCEITGSGIKNVNVMKSPIEIPMAPLIKRTSRACVKTIFEMVFGLAPRALMIPNSRC